MSDRMSTTPYSVTISGGDKDHIQRIRLVRDVGSIQLWITLKQDDREYFQYLSPHEAMTMAQMLDRLAVEAFREDATAPLPA